MRMSTRVPPVMPRRSRASSLVVLVALASLCFARPPAASQRTGASRRPLRIVIQATAPARDVPRFGRFEVTFTIEGARPAYPHWPYDPAPPHGIPAGAGITVEGVLVDPSGREYRQPAFEYQQFLDEVRNGRDWHYPTPTLVWKLRFSPNQVGAWKYRISARDRSGLAETEWRPFVVVPSTSRGFVRVSRADSRYFEFDDGSFFTGLGFQLPEYLEDPTSRGGPAYQELGANGIDFVRLWVSSLYGSAWNPYVGGRNRYAGYVPVAGLMPFRDDTTEQTALTMQMDYEPGGDLGWFDACRLQAGNGAEAVKPRTRYRVSARYRARRIAGPRIPRFPAFGFVLKVGGMFPDCYEPGTSRAVSSYGGNNADWSEISGVWNSGERNFLPKVHLALENVTQGAVFVDSLSVREFLPDGSVGLEILSRPSMHYDLYIPQAPAYAFDKIVEFAERNGVYLKLVVMEKGDEIYSKLDDSGDFVTSRDNNEGVYGTGRTVNKTRWLQQAWWRYLQARWGYSPSIHSWELLNEGDPASVRHYQLADEFGKFMHFTVFGVSPQASFDHPDDHLVTTSFWHSFPAAQFWANPEYRHIDYADLHAYVSTTFAPPSERRKMQSDAAYYHLWHSQFVAAARIGKPVVRGEAGLDVPGRQDESALGLQRDREGVWLHNFLWSRLDAGGLYEIYWWRSHISNKQNDLTRSYRLVRQFLSELDVNKGGYEDWHGTVSNAAMRVVGQKNLRAGTMHLWVQNTNHTWKNVVDQAAIPSISGVILVPGFKPGTKYDLEWWDTWAAEKAVRTEQVVASRSGDVRIEIRDLGKDLALKLRLKTSGGTHQQDRKDS